MNETLQDPATERSPNPVRSGLRWLESKLSRVTSSREFVPEIDGLRFIAIFSVVLFHAAGHVLELQHRPHIPDKWAPGQSLFLVVVGNLSLGVQLFFAISGFVVALPFARSAIQSSPKPSLGRYFMRRLTRIEPPYVLALLVMYYLAGRYRFYLPHLLAGLLYAHKWVFGTPNPINVVTWTLEAEVLFYVLAPFITSIYSIPVKTVRWSWQLAIIGLDSYFVHQWFLYYGRPYSYFSFLAALPYFLTGVLLADLYASGLLSRTGRGVWDAVALLGFAALIFTRGYQHGWRVLWFSPFLIMLLVTGAIKGVVVSRFLRFRPITLIGGMCYSIYLWHTPIIARLDGFAATLPRGLSDLQLAALYSAAAVPIIFLISTLIYYFTERPFMNGPGSRFIERTLREGYARLGPGRSRWATPAKAETGQPAEPASPGQS